MQKDNKFFEAIVDYPGVEGNANTLPLKKGDIVLMIEDEFQWITVRKDRLVGKVQKRVLHEINKGNYQIIPNQSVQVIQKQNSDSHSISSQLSHTNNAPNPFANAKSSFRTIQSNQIISQTKSITQTNNQQSLIIPLIRNTHIQQQLKQQTQQQINTISQSGFSSAVKTVNDKEITQPVIVLKGIINEIQKIIINYSFIGEGKEIKIREILNQLKKKHSNELQDIFFKDEFGFFNQQIKDCSTRIEMVLLDIIEFVVEKGILQYDQNIFFNYIQSSCLLDKIIILIIEKENNQKLYSDLSEQLIRIYLWLFQYKQIDFEMMNICIRILDNILSDILIRLQIISKNEDQEKKKEKVQYYEKLNQKDENKKNKKENNKQKRKIEIKNDENKKYEKENNKQKKNEKEKDKKIKEKEKEKMIDIEKHVLENIEQENEQLNKELVGIISTIKVAEKFKDFSGNIPQPIIQLIEERITQLIHLNCALDLECPHQLIVPNLKCIHEFKTTAFNILLDYASENNDFMDYLVSYHNIHLHISYPIIQYTAYYNSNKRINDFELQSVYQYTPQFILLYIKHLIFLIHSQNCSQITNIPNLLSSLIKLINYNLSSHISIEQDKQSLEIRRYSRECLNQFQSFGDQFVQGRVLASGYAGSLLSVISTASVIGSQNDQEIHSALSDIKEFLDILHNGRQYDSYKHQHQFPPLTKLIKQFNEQFEEEEGLEEIEAQVISQRYNQNFTDFSKETKSAVLNIFLFLKRLQSPPDSDSDDDDDEDDDD